MLILCLSIFFFFASQIGHCLDFTTYPKEIEKDKVTWNLNISIFSIMWFLQTQEKKKRFSRKKSSWKYIVESGDSCNMFPTDVSRKLRGFREKEKQLSGLFTVTNQSHIQIHISSKHFLLKSPSNGVQISTCCLFPLRHEVCQENVFALMVWEPFCEICLLSFLRF